MRLWANDNAALFPWQVPVVDGGSLGSYDWTDHYRAASNELSTPKVLYCPTDKDRAQLASATLSSPMIAAAAVAPRPNIWNVLDGGRNVSYFVGLSADEAKPHSILAGDGRIGSGTGGSDIIYTGANGTSIDLYFEGGQMHSRTSGEMGRGFLVLADASVHSATTAQFREYVMSALASGTTNVTISLPRGVE
jgi:hypothetical protein